MNFDFASIIRRVADRKIEEAIAEGKFDDLPGKGQPLNLEEDASIPAHDRAANRVLKNAGVLPDWMQLDREIDQMREENARAWARAEREYPSRRARLESASPGPAMEKRRKEFVGWLSRARTAYLGGVKAVNFEITKANMMSPNVARVHIPYRVAEETARFDDAFPAIGEMPEEAAETRTTGQGMLRDSAIGLYRYGRGGEADKREAS
jgi:hypothetical protein